MYLENMTRCSNFPSECTGGYYCRHQCTGKLICIWAAIPTSALRPDHSNMRPASRTTHCTQQAFERVRASGAMNKALAMSLCGIVCSNTLVNHVPYVGLILGHPRDRREYSPLYYNDILVSKVWTVVLIGSKDHIWKMRLSIVTNARGNSSAYGNTQECTRVRPW